MPRKKKPVTEEVTPVEAEMDPMDPTLPSEALPGEAATDAEGLGEEGPTAGGAAERAPMVCSDEEWGRRLGKRLFKTHQQTGFCTEQDYIDRLNAFQQATA